jgi:hypothetical protein
MMLWCANLLTFVIHTPPCSPTWERITALPLQESFRLATREVKNPRALAEQDNAPHNFNELTKETKTPILPFPKKTRKSNNHKNQQG